MHVLSSTSVHVKDRSNKSCVLRRPSAPNLKCYIIHEIWATTKTSFPVVSIVISNDKMSLKVWDTAPCILVGLLRTTLLYVP
jgi:hypothetical protein